MNLYTFAYDIKWTGPTATNVLYDLSHVDSNYSAFYVTFNMDWRSEWLLNDDNSIALLADLGYVKNLVPMK